MAGHTPGPWTAYSTAKTGSWAVAQVDGPRICAMPHPHPKAPIAKPLAAWHTDAANARLIAAAPDLLAALEETLSAIEAFPASGLKVKPNGGIAKALRAAIAKARGDA